MKKLMYWFGWVKKADRTFSEGEVIVMLMQQREKCMLSWMYCTGTDQEHREAIENTDLVL